MDQLVAKAASEALRQGTIGDASRVLKENVARNWEELGPLVVGKATLTRHRVLAGQGGSGPAHNALDMMRTKVAHLMEENRWTTLCVTAPTRRCGTTTVALNLAWGLAQQKDKRVVLLDLNLRQPSIAQSLGAQVDVPLDAFLRSECTIGRCFRRIGNNLALGMVGRPSDAAASLLHDGSITGAVASLKRRLMPDFIICDLHPMLASDDVLAFLPTSDCSLLVVEAMKSNRHDIDVCERDLAEQSNLLGVVVNKVDRKSSSMKKNTSRVSISQK